ncbi:MAG: acetylornithine/N-succinyldiaminopimelate aminotransferase [Rhodothermales bacterium]|jgi:acetylornithine/N-succinyldiaminopimelate aminotransferase
METDAIATQQDQFVLATYAPKHWLVRGEGCYLWDASDRRFLDFGAGISVCNLGHCHPAVTAAIQEQAATLVHVSNLYYNALQPQLAAAIAEQSFFGRVFFANSGAEANEGMIKFARKWGADQGKGRQIICMEHSFHGRTLATLAATDKPAIRDPFGPAVPGFSHVPFNDLDAIAAAITPETCAVMLEPVQGEGGVYPAAPGFLEGVRELCDDRNILMLLDEVQTGVGRTGSMFAYQRADIEPDAMSLAKALGNGFPIGAFTVQQVHADVLGVSSHATTFGGTPLACAAGLAVMQTLAESDILAQVPTKAERLVNGLKALPGICEVRNAGLLVGAEFANPVGPIIAAAADGGLLVLSAGTHVLRLLPPLVVTDDEIDAALAILNTVCAELNP